MLHLMRRYNLHMPIIFHRDPWFPKKYEFADRMIAEWGLEVYDYPPYAMSLTEGEDIMAFSSHYQIGFANGQVVTMQVPKNIVSPELYKPWKCGLDVLKRPTGTFNYPFDAVLIGHKDTDSDQIAGSVKLHVDVKLNGGMGPDLLFPLKHWTDEDIWEYTERYNVPQQETRYSVEDRKELPDKHANSDYAHICISCCNKKSAAVVRCPKLGMMVNNVSDKVNYTQLTGGYYGKPCS